MLVDALNAKLGEQEHSMAELKLSHISKATSSDEIQKLKDDHAIQIEDFESQLKEQNQLLIQKDQ